VETLNTPEATEGSRPNATPRKKAAHKKWERAGNAAFRAARRVLREPAFTSDGLLMKIHVVGFEFDAVGTFSMPYQGPGTPNGRLVASLMMQLLLSRPSARTCGAREDGAELMLSGPPVRMAPARRFTPAGLFFLLSRGAHDCALPRACVGSPQSYGEISRRRLRAMCFEWLCFIT
jgi:hypothetical protein